MLCKKKAEKLKDQHVFELLGSVNPEYEPACAQVTSQGPLPPTRIVFALFLGEKKSKESYISPKNSSHSPPSDCSALRNNNNTVSGGGSGRGCGGVAVVVW